jgi:hypothetical protein
MCQSATGVVNVRMFVYQHSAAIVQIHVESSLCKARLEWGLAKANRGQSAEVTASTTLQPVTSSTQTPFEGV